VPRFSLYSMATFHRTLCFVLLAVVATGQAIQQGRGGLKVRIAGQLLDFRELPLADAAIGIARWDMTVWKKVATSSPTGEFDVSVLLQPGDYRLIAAFGTYQVAAGNLQVRAPVNGTVEVKMRASAQDARSDRLPPSTPPPGLLPKGSFRPVPIIAKRRRQPAGEMSREFSAPPSPPPPVPKPGTQELVNVFYVTNRTPVAGSPAHYADTATDRLTTSYGICRVSIPATHQVGNIERPSIWRFERTEDVNQHMVITARELSKDGSAFQSNLQEAFKESGSEAFLFIHGYNVPFDDAVLRTAQLFRDLEFNGVPILFSWPAQDAWWRYPAAEDAVGDSSRKLEEFISETLSKNKLTAVNVIAHSMGNRVLEGALDRLTLRNIHAGFKNVVMAAPDINIADLDNVSTILRASAAHATVYASSQDLALLASKAFHSYLRLGEAPPPRVANGVDTIDASAIPHDLLGHSYFADSGTVIRDLFLLLTDGLTPQARLLLPSVGALRYWIIPKQ
jgi:esterase/lipase superfamily enzyme